MPRQAARDETLGALERSVGRGSARIELQLEFCFEVDIGKPRQAPPTKGPRLRRLVRRLGSWSWRLLWSAIMRLMGRWLRKQGVNYATGVIDFRAHRCRYRHLSDSREVFVSGDSRSEVAPGGARASSGDGFASALEPVWLFDLIRGVVDAREQSEAETLDGHTCRRFAAYADLNRVAEAVSYQVAVPSGVDRLDDLKRIPVKVWLDDEGYIRRIRHRLGNVKASTGTLTLNLSEFGIELPSDWSSPSPPTDAASAAAGGPS